MNLKAWLRRPPQPAKILCDGKPVLIGAGPRRWAEAEESILSLGGSRIEAQNAEGVTLRATVLDLEGDTTGDATAEKGGAGLSGLQGLSSMAQLAKIIGDISDQAAMRHQAAYTMAFGELVKMNQSILERLSNSEIAWQQALNQIAELRMQLVDAQQAINEAQEENGGAITGLLAAVAEGSSKKEAPTHANGKVNGKPNGKAKPS